MSTIANVYGTAVTATPTALTSLANGSAVCLASISTAVLRVADLFVSFDVKFASYLTTGSVSLYALTSHDGARWGESASASQGTLATAIANRTAITYLSTLPQAREVVSVNTGFDTVYFADYLGKYMGLLPPYIALFLVNNSGGALHATYAHAAYYTPVTYEYV